MATLRENIFIRCTTYVPLAALIDNRCYPVRLPADVELPAISYAQISDVDDDWRSHGESTPRSVARVSFDCWGESSNATAEVADGLVEAWSGYSLAEDIGWAQIAMRQDNYETSLNRYRTIVDILIEYRR